MNGLYFLDALREMIETAFFTGQVTGEIPVSIILVGPSGTAKSMLLKSYIEPSIHITDNVSSVGLSEIAQNDTKNEKRFILIPDINPTLSRRQSTAQSTVANLLSLTTDGTVRVDDGRREKICKHDPMGLVTACTPEIYDKHAKQWFALGLRRRILPIFYIYSFGTETELQKLTRNGKIHASVPPRIPLEFKPYKHRPAINPTIAMEIERFSVSLSQNLGKLQFFAKAIKMWEVKKIVPISPHVTLRTLAMAHALKRKSAQVNKDDLTFLKSFIEFTDPENPKQI